MKRLISFLTLLFFVFSQAASAEAVWSFSGNSHLRSRASNDGGKGKTVVALLQALTGQRPPSTIPTPSLQGNISVAQDGAARKFGKTRNERALLTQLQSVVTRLRQPENRRKGAAVEFIDLKSVLKKGGWVRITAPRDGSFDRSLDWLMQLTHRVGIIDGEAQRGSAPKVYRLMVRSDKVFEELRETFDEDKPSASDGGERFSVGSFNIPPEARLSLEDFKRELEKRFGNIDFTQEVTPEVASQLDEFLAYLDLKDLQFLKDIPMNEEDLRKWGNTRYRLYTSQNKGIVLWAAIIPPGTFGHPHSHESKGYSVYRYENYMAATGKIVTREMEILDMRGTFLALVPALSNDLKPREPIEQEAGDGKVYKEPKSARYIHQTGNPGREVAVLVSLFVRDPSLFVRESHKAGEAVSYFDPLSDSEALAHGLPLEQKDDRGVIVRPVWHQPRILKATDGASRILKKASEVPSERSESRDGGNQEITPTPENLIALVQRSFASPVSIAFNGELSEKEPVRLKWWLGESQEGERLSALEKIDVWSGFKDKPIEALAAITAKLTSDLKEVVHEGKEVRVVGGHSGTVDDAIKKFTAQVKAWRGIDEKTARDGGAQRLMELYTARHPLIPTELREDILRYDVFHPIPLEEMVIGEGPVAQDITLSSLSENPVQVKRGVSSVFLYDTKTGEVLLKKNFDQSISGTAVDGDLLAVKFTEGSLFVFDVRDGKPIFGRKPGDTISSVAWPFLSGNRVAVRLNDDTVAVFDAKADKRIFVHQFDYSLERPFRLAGRFLGVKAIWNEVSIFDVEAKRETARLKFGGEVSIPSISGNRVGLRVGDRSFFVYDAGNGDELFTKTFKQDIGVPLLAGNRVWVTVGKSTLFVRDLETSQELTHRFQPYSLNRMIPVTDTTVALELTRSFRPAVLKFYQLPELLTSVDSDGVSAARDGGEMSFGYSNEDIGEIVDEIVSKESIDEDDVFRQLSVRFDIVFTPEERGQIDWEGKKIRDQLIALIRAKMGGYASDGNNRQSTDAFTQHQIRGFLQSTLEPFAAARSDARKIAPAVYDPSRPVGTLLIYEELLGDPSLVERLRSWPKNVPVVLVSRSGKWKDVLKEIAFFSKGVQHLDRQRFSVIITPTVLGTVDPHLNIGNPADVIKVAKDLTGHEIVAYAVERQLAASYETMLPEAFGIVYEFPLEGSRQVVLGAEKFNELLSSLMEHLALPKQERRDLKKIWSVPPRSVGNDIGEYIRGYNAAVRGV